MSSRSIRSLKKLTAKEIIDAADWVVPDDIARDRYLQNMDRALNYFRRTVPLAVLQSNDPLAWTLPIEGKKIRLMNWLHAINFRYPVNHKRTINKGNWLIAYRDILGGNRSRPGNWYTTPLTSPKGLAIYRSQSRVTVFRARCAFVCLESRVSDAFAGWNMSRAGEYRHGSGQQLFIWDARRFLEPVGSDTKTPTSMFMPAD